MTHSCNFDSVKSKWNLPHQQIHYLNTEEQQTGLISAQKTLGSHSKLCGKFSQLIFKKGIRVDCMNECRSVRECVCVALTHCGEHTNHSEGLWSPNTPHKWCTARSSPRELSPPTETKIKRESADMISVFVIKSKSGRLHQGGRTRFAVLLSAVECELSPVLRRVTASSWAREAWWCMLGHLTGGLGNSA